jgi:hypothetical protein
LPPKITATLADRAAITSVLKQLGADLGDVLSHGGGRFVVLKPGQEYCDVSPFMRARFIYDPWPHSPGGVFIPDEMTAYLRTVTPMSVAHEAMHMVDKVLGRHEYRSAHDSAIRNAYDTAWCYVTPYGACDVAEFWAEHARAWFGINNPESLWPTVSRERLLTVNPTMYAIVKETFERTIPALAANVRAVRAARRSQTQARKMNAVAA